MAMEADVDELSWICTKCTPVLNMEKLNRNSNGCRIILIVNLTGKTGAMKYL